VKSRHLSLTGFSARPPPRALPQRESLDWLADIHAAAEATLEGLDPSERDAFAIRLRRVMDRVACGPSSIAWRASVLAEVGSAEWSKASLYDPTTRPHGAGTDARNKAFAEHVNAYFEEEYADVDRAPKDLIHVTCSGYVAPSGAQRVVAAKGWGALTRVTHAYHMGCYASLPATRMACGYIWSESLREMEADRRVDIVHTELCSLHLDPSDHTLEQLVVQSLFADGDIRYSVKDRGDYPGLEILALAEEILPSSADSMSWAVSDFGMRMTLSREVPDQIAGVLRKFVAELYLRADLQLGDTLAGTVFAVHPGGPKIIDRVAQVLELAPGQVQASREVLFEHGNMSSATLPYIWMRVIADDRVVAGTLVLSLAFGPGLTISGGLFRKH
jgi:predicted naringenin-chalcone synthase